MIRKATKQKAATSAKAKDDEAQRLVIPTRHVMRDTMDDDNTPADEKDTEITSAPKVPKSKPIVIVPRDDTEDDSASKDTKAPTEEKSKPAASQPPVQAQVKHMDIKPSVEDSTPSAPEAKPTPPAEAEDTKPKVPDNEEQPAEAEDNNVDAASTSEETDKPATRRNDIDVPIDDSAEKGPSPETKKAVEKAEKELNRQRELQGYIDNKQFFVPIGTVERKRSIKISFGLTVLVLALGLILVDLMLDSGAILLVQKIPHTHFFSTSSSKNE